MPDDPELPYGGTQGWSGTDTSRERAHREARDGTVSARQQGVLNALAAVGPVGMTVVDVRRSLGLHHGQASSVLSTLHLTGRIAMLAERRDRSHPYVLTQFVGDRETLPHKANKPKTTDGEDVAIAKLQQGLDDLDAGLDADVQAADLRTVLDLLLRLLRRD